MKKLVVLLLSLLVIAPAAAHTALVSANPESGADLSEAPTEVRLQFNQDLLMLGDTNPNKLEVRNEAGAIISGSVVIDGPTISVSIDEERAVSGSYSVNYRVVSSDGHPVEGEYNFTISSGTVSPEPIVEAPEDGPNLLLRFIWVLLALSGIGILALLRLRK